MRITLHVVRVLLDTFGSGSGARSSHHSSYHTQCRCGGGSLLRTLHTYSTLVFTSKYMYSLTLLYSLPSSAVFVSRMRHAHGSCGSCRYGRILYSNSILRRDTNHLYSIARAISRSATFRITEPPLSLVLFAEYRCKPAGRCSGALSGDPAPPGQLFPAG